MKITNEELSTKYFYFASCNKNNLSFFPTAVDGSKKETNLSVA